MTSQPLILATRGSLLARTQSQWVADYVSTATGRPVELLIVSTRGDRIQDRPLSQVGGKGLFTKEIEEALLDGRAHFAVHSMKDMPTEQPEGLVIGAVPEREDPRDVLVGASLDELPQGARVGTGSARRRQQLAALRPDLQLLDLRGNVDTRVRKQREGEYDAIVLAAAGLRRLGHGDTITAYLSVEQMIPAVGQGALAVQCRADDADTLAALQAIHHEPTAIAIAAERAFLIELQGGCSVPAGAHAWFEGDQLKVLGFWAADDGRVYRNAATGAPSQADALGVTVAQAVRA